MPANVTDIDEFTSPITRPVDAADARTAASLAGIYQGFANRTRHLLNRLLALRTIWSTDLGGAGLYWTDGADTPTPRSRTVRFSALHAAGVGALIGGGTGALLNENNQTLIWNLSNLLPEGATVTRLRVVVQPGDDLRAAQTSVPGDGGRMVLAIGSYAATFSGSPAFGTYSVLSGNAVEDAGGLSVQMIEWNGSRGIGKTVVHLATLKAGNNAAAENDGCGDLEVTFLEPGPGDYR